eukprot:scaffold205335_cov53-Cyclotella_meneghiniana.AAC.2
MAATVGPWGEVRNDGRLAVSLLSGPLKSNEHLVDYKKTCPNEDSSTHQCEKISSTAGNKVVKRIEQAAGGRDAEETFGSLVLLRQGSALVYFDTQIM